MSAAMSVKSTNVHLYRVLVNCDWSKQEPDRNVLMPQYSGKVLENFRKTFEKTNFQKTYLEKCIYSKSCTLQVSRLETTPGLRTLANLPVINGLITSFLPSVILRIFLKLLPNLLGFMSHVQGMTSLSQVDFGVLRKYFIFQV